MLTNNSSCNHIYSTESNKTLQNGKYNFYGEYDWRGLRRNNGCQDWNDKVRKRYAGSFFYNNLHGKGFYFIKKENTVNFYDGQFYRNELAGYGQVIHNNGQMFEGLFKQNKRYGPGVLSCDNGTEDVGLWDGFSLIRLCIDLSSGVVPTLTNSPQGKIKLMKYKTLIEVCDSPVEPARQVLQTLGVSDDVLNKYPKLYNPHVRNPNSLFFDRRVYDLAYFGSEDFSIDVIDNVDEEYITEEIGDEEDHAKCECMNERLQQLENQIIDMRKELRMVQAAKLKYKNQLCYCIKCCIIENDEEMFSVKSNLNGIEEEDENYEYGNIPSPADRICTCSDNKIEGADFLQNQVEKLTVDERFYLKVIDFLNNKLYNELYNARGCKQETKTNKILVSHLLAWNNEKRNLDMLRYCFRCRNFEDIVGFNVKSLLMGDRKLFNDPGEYEKACAKFLMHCATGIYTDASLILLKFNINPDVCDAKGNAGIHLATSKDHVQIICLLTDSGANLNLLNDECLTPLTICLLRYISFYYGVINWESAFLPKIDSNGSPDETQWRMRQSSINSNEEACRSESSRSSNSLGKTSMEQLQKYLSQMDRWKIRNTTMLNCQENYIFSTEFIDNTSKKSVKVASTSEHDSAVLGTLELIAQTARELIKRGADANIGNVPFPPIVLVIYTRNPMLVENLLKHNADPNITIEDELTPLHLLATLDLCPEYLEITRIFLRYSSNPNRTTSPDFWTEQNAQLIGKYTYDKEVIGKTAIQLLCMRKDFSNSKDCFLICDMVQTLIEYKARRNDLYLGHSLISLAVLRGNVPLIRLLLKHENHHVRLGSSMGNVLSILALRRYPYLIPLHVCKEVIDVLVANGNNPFDKVHLYSNVFEFLEYDDPLVSTKLSKKRNKYVKTKNKKSKIKKKYLFDEAKLIKGPLSSKSTKIKKECNLLSRVYIKQKGRHIIEYIYQFQAVFYLYCFAEQDFLTHQFIKNIAMLVTIDDVIRNLQLIFQSGTLPIELFSEIFTWKLLKLVQQNNQKSSGKRKKSPKGKGNFSKRKRELKKKFKSKKKISAHTKNVGNKSSALASCSCLFQSQLDELRIKRRKSPQPEKLARYVFDRRPQKYDVCFHCLRRRTDDQPLFTCVECGIVKFCTRECYNLNRQIATIHKCLKKRPKKLDTNVEIGDGRSILENLLREAKVRKKHETVRLEKLPKEIEQLQEDEKQEDDGNQWKNKEVNLLRQAHNGKFSKETVRLKKLSKEQLQENGGDQWKNKEVNLLYQAQNGKTSKDRATISDIAKPDNILVCQPSCDCVPAKPFPCKTKLYNLKDKALERLGVQMNKVTYVCCENVDIPRSERSNMPVKRHKTVQRTVCESELLRRRRLDNLPKTTNATTHDIKPKGPSSPTSDKSAKGSTSTTRKKRSSKTRRGEESSNNIRRKGTSRTRRGKGSSSTIRSKGSSSTTRGKRTSRTARHKGSSSTRRDKRTSSTKRHKGSSSMKRGKGSSGSTYTYVSKTARKKYDLPVISGAKDTGRSGKDKYEGKRSKVVKFDKCLFPVGHRRDKRGKSFDRNTKDVECADCVCADDKKLNRNLLEVSLRGETPLIHSLKLFLDYFPDINIECLLQPYTCYTDGRFYYKFPNFGNIYSRI